MGIRSGLAGLSLSVLLSALGTSVANVALPTLAGAFSATFPRVQWVVLGYLLAITTLVVSAGRLGDLLGRRRALLGGLAVFTAASVLCGLAPSLWLLVAGRVAQGLGAALMMALALAFVGDTVPKERTGRAMGLLGTMSAVGTALGPTLGGVLIAGFGWRAVFLVGAPLGAVALVLAYRYLPADRATGDRAGFDRVGTALLALTLTAYALALTVGRGEVTMALIAVSAVGLGFFLRSQRRVANPLVRLGMLRDRVLAPGLASSAIVSTVMMATLVVGPFHLSRALGLAPAVVGLVMTVGPLVTALTGVPAGRLVDRVGARRVTLLGLSALALGCGLLAVAPASLGIAGYVVPLAVTTAGYALFQTANNTAVMADVPADRRGVVSGLLNLARNLGLVTGTSALGAVFAWASSSADITTAVPAGVAAGTRATFAVAVGLIAVALAVAAKSRVRREALSAR
ncbi:MFS transporter [Actinokineospora auranticolor]|uniref:EmrB/QacA subfamily drug resistance transporter n=1 Tax=Actinokineospora auranticolor TaxID=155976 RepID=A0A2S6GT21_9PSEU|nr:MFS transporter [Actinokineospora auranticolor]PPK68339.1 EmrB/QacA subfamily drug resistance transporter [Actinokineospora auranticolor]